MAEIKITVDDGEILDRLRELKSETRVKVWANAILELARRQARQRIGTGFGQTKVAESVRIDLRGPEAEVYTDDYIAIHVHQGGPIRSRNGKKLAIPLPNGASAKYNPQRLFARDLGRSVPLIKLQSRGGNELLFREPGEGEKLEEPLFVLKDETRSQRPRPWFPTLAEAEAETIRFFKEDL